MLKLLSMKATCEMTSLSKSHIAREEEAGRFPKRIRLSEHPRGRFGYVLSEVQEWLQKRVERGRIIRR